MNTVDDIRWMNVLRAIAISAVVAILVYGFRVADTTDDTAIYSLIRTVVAILSAWFVLEGLNQNTAARNAATQLDFLKIQIDLRKKWQDWRSEMVANKASDGREKGFSVAARMKAEEYWSCIVLDEFRALQDLRPAAMPGVWSEHAATLRDAMSNDGILAQEYLTYVDFNGYFPAYEQRYRNMLSDLWEAVRKGRKDLKSDDELRQLRSEDIEQYKSGLHEV
jgi:hypothetical protein